LDPIWKPDWNPNRRKEEEEQDKGGQGMLQLSGEADEVGWD